MLKYNFTAEDLEYKFFIKKNLTDLDSVVSAF